MTPHERWLADVRERVDSEIDQRLELSALVQGPQGGQHLREAVRYAALGPGKRLRPALAVAACRAAGGCIEAALPAAAAVEMLHAYTLVHDDLPAMDDDEMRRGRPTVHIKFGEAVAILAGDALLTEAFVALADMGDAAADAVRVLGARGGTQELLAGQALDLDAERSETPLSFDQLEAIHRGKTGALFSAAAELGGISAGCSSDDRARLAELGMVIGVAFQHGDDRLDGEHEGYRERAQARVEELAARARELLEHFEAGREHLEALVQWIAVRR